jgi:hypothetical protein
MNARYIAYLIITSIYLNYANGINSHINKVSIFKSNSEPDLRSLYNTTFYTSYTAKNIDINNIPVHSDKYKALIYNKYRRNIYLRSKEKYNEYNK